MADRPPRNAFNSLSDEGFKFIKAVQADVQHERGSAIDKVVSGEVTSRAPAAEAAAPAREGGVSFETGPDPKRAEGLRKGPPPGMINR